MLKDLGIIIIKTVENYCIFCTYRVHKAIRMDRKHQLLYNNFLKWEAISTGRLKYYK